MTLAAEPYRPKPLPLLFAQKNYCDGATDWCLDVRFTAKCFAACSFCIAADDMKYNARDFHPERMVEAVVSTKDRKVSGLSIIGGEPLLYLRELNDFMDAVRERAPHIKNMYLTTALPATIKTQRAYFDRVMEKTAVLNVSIQHHDPEKNNQILNTKSKLNRLELLEDILKPEGRPEKIRVHLNLARGGVDNAHDLNRTLYVLREMGIQEVKVNELMNAPEDYVSFEEITGLKLDSPFSGGCSTFIDYFPDMKINLKRSCFIVEESRQASKADLLKMMWKEENGFIRKTPYVARVLYEDGTLTNGWQGEKV